ncbi:MAG: NAD(P)-dependent oxidoreductase [Anaerolineales bacterium]|nr:NAD(P)-dependent oxidoreductase [Chloroflexota bacterium]MBL6981385.1 NAD(P)-dependent oxidoreductase [Anaerolineales bacterium]
MSQAIPSEFLAIDRKSRARAACGGLVIRNPEERVGDFDDVVIPLGAECAQLEASRCIHCPDPAGCVEACPTHNDIPSAMWLIEQGEFLEAAKLYRQTSSLPEICSRVCPHEQLCEGACVVGKSGDTVMTGALETFVMDFERAVEDYQIPVGEPTGKKVAIIGSGPSGISCAEQLVKKGHSATIFEALPSAGGLLTYGIPNFKLPKEVVFTSIHDLEKAGVKFEYGVFIGKDKTIEDLIAEGFDAVFIGVGSQIDAPLKAEGVDLTGVHLATEFLIRSNVSGDLLPHQMRDPLEIGEKVVVIGGGDTASDSLRSALRLGAKEVSCLYRRTLKEMPGGSKDRKLAMEEGAQYKFLTQPIKFIAGDDGNLAAVECLQMELGEPDDSGRRRPVKIEGSNFIVEANTAVLALGYWPDETIGKTTPGLETHNWGLITIDKETGATSVPGVYSGGDAATGPDLVVTAMVAGRKAAWAIDEYLKV